MKTKLKKIIAIGLVAVTCTITGITLASGTSIIKPPVPCEYHSVAVYESYPVPGGWYYNSWCENGTGTCCL